MAHISAHNFFDHAPQLTTCERIATLADPEEDPWVPWIPPIQAELGMQK